MAFPNHNNSAIKEIIELKKENEKLQETINYLKMENFEYALKCSRVENILSNIQAVTRNNADKLVDASQKLFSIIHLCNTGQAEPKTTTMTPEIQQHSIKNNLKSTEENSLRYNNKAHVVKPHMVNGTVLHIPTINLTRVSDLHLQSSAGNTLQNTRNSLERNVTADIDSSDDANETEPTATDEFRSENQLSTLGEVSDASTSQSSAHSTVLSGNFHEVKIFLNPINQDVLKRESRKTLNSLRRSQPSDSPRNKTRCAETCDYVTRSRRIN